QALDFEPLRQVKKSPCSKSPPPRAPLHKMEPVSLTSCVRSPESPLPTLPPFVDPHFRVKLQLARPVLSAPFKSRRRGPPVGDMSVIIRRPVLAQAHLSTEEAPSLAEARLHGPQQHQERPRRPQAPHAQGQVAARCLNSLPAVHARIGTSMRKELRLRRRKDFDAVFRRGRSWHNELLVLRTLPNALEHNRYGFVT